MDVKRGRVKLRIFADRIVMEITASNEKSALTAAPREGKTVLDTLRSIIIAIDNLPPPFLVGQFI